VFGNNVFKNTRPENAGTTYDYHCRGLKSIVPALLNKNLKNIKQVVLMIISIF
jgi:hypothetical protein